MKDYYECNADVRKETEKQAYTLNPGMPLNLKAHKRSMQTRDSEPKKKAEQTRYASNPEPKTRLCKLGMPLIQSLRKRQ